MLDVGLLLVLLKEGVSYEKCLRHSRFFNLLNFSIGGGYDKWHATSGGDPEKITCMYRG